jgi:hypothetical protein
MVGTVVPEIIDCIEVRGDHHGATKRKKSVPGHKPCATSLQAVLNTLSNTVNMPRNKKAARRGNSHATPRRRQGQGQETDSDFIQFDGASGPKTMGHNGKKAYFCSVGGS